ncbi:LamG domain-containing protein, partial [Cribrihabitans sp. XS_ASV171]
RVNATQTTYWRLIDPAGKQEITRTSFQDSSAFTLKRSGTYTLLVEGRVYEGTEGAIDYAFVLQPQVTEEIAADLDATGARAGLSDAIGPEGDRAQGFTGYERVEIEDPAVNRTGDVSFSLWFKPDLPQRTWQPLVYRAETADARDRQYTLWLNSGGYLHLTTSDANGQVAVNSPGGSVRFDSWNHATGVIDRETDTLNLYLNGVLAGTTALRDQEAVTVTTPLSLGGEIGGQSGFEGAMSDFRLYGGALSAEDAEALAGGGDAATDPLLHLAMNEAPGAEILADATGNDRTGKVVDLTEPMAGVFKNRIETAGEVHVYSFSLDEDQRIYWDTMGNRGDIRAELRGPNGLNISRTLNATGANFNGGNYSFEAPAGDYTLTVRADAATKAAYALRLLQFGDAELIDADGTDVIGAIPAGRASAAFAFDVTEGEQILVDMNSIDQGAGNSAWRLFDPFGQLILGPLNADDIAATTMQFTGRYTLVLESQRGLDPHQDIAYRFQVNRISTEEIAISPGGDNPEA